MSAPYFVLDMYSYRMLILPQPVKNAGAGA